MVAAEQSEGARELRAALRGGLTAALKARDGEVVAALRTAIAAIDNAEAVAVADLPITAGSGGIAGAVDGVGSAEVPRRVLSGDDLREILRAQVSEHAREADGYQALGQAAAAGRLRARARALAAYLDEG